MVGGRGIGNTHADEAVGNIGRGDAWGKLCRLVTEVRFAPLAGL
jgi:hypothetical protein